MEKEKEILMQNKKMNEIEKEGRKLQEKIDKMKTTEFPLNKLNWKKDEQ